MYLLGIAGQYCGKYRKENQDYSTFIFNKNGVCLAALADGMGGHYGSKNAANIAINELKNEFLKKNISQNLSIKEIQQWIISVCKIIKERMQTFVNSNTSSLDMGTTLNFVIIQNNKIFSVNIGDSRNYFISMKSIVQLSKDQNLLNDQIKNKDLFSSEKYNIFQNSLTSALGPNKNYKIEIKLLDNIDKGWILLCSDGVYSVIDDRGLLATIIRPINLFSKIQALINQAFIQDSKDNSSAVIININN